MRDLMNDLGKTELTDLIAGYKFPLEVRGVKLAAGQGILPKGRVLAEPEAGEYKALAAGGKADCILAEEIDTGDDEAVTAVAYTAGYFIASRLILAESDTIDTHEPLLRMKNIHLSASVDEKGVTK